MREELEQREIDHLSPLAMKSRHSKGRQYEEPQSPDRTCFQRDRDRIIHSKAFRRLKHKTQVFSPTESDHARSRLTHSIEVSQISRHIARMLRVNEDLSEAIALAHDLGHTPFGHAGERTLNKLMTDYGGFEHNQHSLYIVDKFEQKYPQFPGLNLTFESRSGLMKHKTPYDTPNIQLDFTTIEAELVNLSDEISYNNHDLDDGLSSKILEDTDLEVNVELWKDAKKAIRDQYSNLKDSELKYLINSYLISTQISNVVKTTQENIIKQALSSAEDVQLAKVPIVTYSKEMEEKAKELRKYLHKTFYSHSDVYRMNKKGQQIIEELFNAFMEDPRLLPSNYQEKCKNNNKARTICDYIAGMTDTYAEKEYQSIIK